MGVIALNDLKAHLGIATADTTDDTPLTTAVNATNDLVRSYTGRDFDLAGSASARVYYPQNTGYVVTDDISSTTGLIVKTDQGDDGTFETTWDATDYQLEPSNGVVGGVSGWPYTRIVAVEGRRFPGFGLRTPVEVTAKWGWAAVPPAVKQAALIKAARLFRRKDSPEGVQGFNDFGPIRVSSREDPDVEMLLAPYRLLPVFIG